MVGRKPGIEGEKLNFNVKATLVTLWKNPSDPLNFMTIHKWLYKQGKVKYKMQTKRVLDKAVREGIIKKVAKQYFLNITPDKFKVLDYLQKLTDKKETMELRVGGWLWSLCQLYCVGMPKFAVEHSDVKVILNIIVSRIARLYEALRRLAEEFEKIKVMPKMEHHIPPEVLREFLLEIAPYYLGSKAGMDGDGLPLKELLLATKSMVSTLPEEITPQNPTYKEIIQKYVREAEKIAKKEEAYWRRAEEQMDETEEYRHFALIIIPPKDIADPEGEEQREIKETLEKDASKPPLYIALHLLSYEKKNVDAVFDFYGRRLFGSKLAEVKESYEKVYAAYRIRNIIWQFEDYDEMTKQEVLRTIQELTQKHGRKSIITFLAFWFDPTPENEALLESFFPFHTREEIHGWLVEGAELCRPIREEIFNELKKLWRKKEEF